MPDSHSSHVGGTSNDRSRPWTRVLLVVVLLTFTGISFAFNLVTPVYEGFDENHHVEFISYVRENNSIPVLPHQLFEAVQPPAYYFLQAWVAEVAGLSEPPIAEADPKPLTNNSPFFRHDPSERSRPFHGGFGTVRYLRFVSTIFGVSTLLLLFFLVRHLFPSREELALSVTATAAFIPQFVLMHSLVNNDAVAILLATALIFACLKMSETVNTSSGYLWAGLAGMALGLGLITKGYLLALIPLPFIAALVIKQSWQRRASVLALVYGVALFVSGWMWVRNVSLYGELWPSRTEEQHLSQALPQSIVHRSLFDPTLRDVFLREVRDTFWYSGGAGQVRAPGAVYFTLDLLMAAVAVGAIGMLVDPSRLQISRFPSRPLLILLAALSLQFAGIVSYNLRIQQYQGRWLFPVISSIATFLVLGFVSVAPALWRRVLVVLFPLALLGLTLYVLVGIHQPAFAV